MYKCEKGEKQYKMCKEASADYCSDCPHGMKENSIEEDITELREMIDSDIEAAGGLENFNQYCCSVEAITSWIDRVLDIVERINKK